MNALFREIIEKQYVVDANGSHVILASGIDINKAKVIEKYIKQIKASTSVEVGCAFGCSSLIIAEALQKNDTTRHYIFDPHQHYKVDADINGGNGWGGIGLLNLERADLLDCIEFHEIESCLGMPELIKKNVRVDFVFIDGWHTTDYTLVDMFFADKLLRPGGIMIIDDSSMLPVEKACSYFITNRDYSVLFNQEKRKSGIARRLLYSLFTALNKVSFLQHYLQKEFKGGVADRACYKDILVLQKNGDDKRTWNHFERF